MITPSRPIGTVTLAIGELNFGSGGTARDMERGNCYVIVWNVGIGKVQDE